MKYLRYGVLALAILLCDSLTKSIAVHCFENEVVITSWLSFEYMLNRGISWSLGASDNAVIFAVLTACGMILEIVLCLYALRRLRNNHAVYGEVALLAGALGNTIDRFYYGGVVDFIMIHYNSFVWPLFNCADIAIVMGALYMVVHSYYEQ